MKLHWSPKSPYVRKVMVVAHEVGVADRIELVRSIALSTGVNPAIQADNPLGKIPTLVLDDGTALFNFFVICEYLAHLAGKAIVPPSGAARWACLQRHALSSGLTDALIHSRNERTRPAEQQLAPLLAALENKISAALDRLDSQAPDFGELPFDLGHAATGCALAYLDFRFAELKWRNGRDALAAWQETFETRPSARATPISDA